MDVQAITLNSDHEAVARHAGVAVGHYLNVFIVQRCGELLTLGSSVIALADTPCRFREEGSFATNLASYTCKHDVVGIDAVESIDIELSLGLSESLFLR